MNIRIGTFFAALAIGILWITLLTWLIAPAQGPDSIIGDLLLDKNTVSFPYPFTIQNLMWLVFFIGAGELCVRHTDGSNEEKQLDRRLLPEDEQTVLRRQDLGDIYRQIRNAGSSHFWLQNLLSRSILAFQTTRSVSQVSSVFNSTLELYQHEVDLRYNLLRYIVWLIPTLGFIGTVVGIALALNSAGDMFAANTSATADLSQLGPELMKSLTKQLGVAFYTTLLALLQSAVLMFAMHLIQGREENALNKIGQYCLDNLINRLYEK